jgi:MFS family permease
MKGQMFESVLWQRFTRLRGSTTFIVFTISLAIFTDTFLYGVIVPVVPFAFESRLGIPRDAIQSWVSISLAIYAGGVIFGSLVFGVIADRLGSRRAFMLSGFLIMEGATSMLCFPKSLSLYMIGRVLQGIAASIVWGIGFAIISDTADRDQVAYLMSYPGIGLSMGIFLGPLLGGIIYDRLGYYAVFYLCFGVFGLDIAVRLLMIEKHDLQRKLMKIEKKRVVKSPESQSDGVWTRQDISATVSNTNAIDSDELYVFKPRLLGLKLPPIVKIVTYPRVVSCLFVTFLIAWLMGALDATLTIHLADTFNFNSLDAGLMFLAIVAPSVVEPINGWVSDKYGPRYLVTAGFLIVIPAMVLLRIPSYHSAGQIAMFTAFLALGGIGFTMIFTPIMAEMTYVINDVESRSPGALGKGKGFSQAYGLINIATSLGQLVGPFVAGAVMTNYGWGVNTIIMSLLGVLGIVPAFLFTGGNIVPMIKAKFTGINEQEALDELRQGRIQE